MTDQINTALLPCPFCGSPARTFAWNGTTQAQCSNPDGNCISIDGYGPVALWNTRAASQADTARAEGIALGLAMAKAAPRFVPSQSCIAGEPFREAVWAADIPDPPIPPHVAAARVLLNTPAALATLVDEAECAAGTGVSFNVVIGRALREVAALEQIAKERPNNETQ